MEEVVEGCIEALQPKTALKMSKLRAQVFAELHVEGHSRSVESNMEIARELTLKQWIQEAKKNNAVVFIAGLLCCLCNCAP